MREYYGNILDLIGKADAICITTNLFVKFSKRAVMGRGIAKAINNILPDIDLRLGKKILDGETVCIIGEKDNTDFVAFPVKPTRIVINEEKDLDSIVGHMKNKFKVGNTVPGWACKAYPTMISVSCEELMLLADKKKYQTIYLPRPGCGAGELNYDDIKPILEDKLDDRFWVSTFKEDK